MTGSGWSLVHVQLSDELRTMWADGAPRHRAHHLLKRRECFYVTHFVEETTMQSQLAPSSRRTWRNVLPAGAPGCSQGTPYSFWVRAGDPTKLAIVLSGGGACWTGENCALHGKPFYRPFAGLEQ